MTPNGPLKEINRRVWKIKQRNGKSHTERRQYIASWSCSPARWRHCLFTPHARAQYPDRRYCTLSSLKKIQIKNYASQMQHNLIKGYHTLSPDNKNRIGENGADATQSFSHHIALPLNTFWFDTAAFRLITFRSVFELLFLFNWQPFVLKEPLNWMNTEASGQTIANSSECERTMRISVNARLCSRYTRVKSSL